MVVVVVHSSSGSNRRKGQSDRGKSSRRRKSIKRRSYSRSERSRSTIREVGVAAAHTYQSP